MLRHSRFALLILASLLAACNSKKPGGASASSPVQPQAAQSGPASVPAPVASCPWDLGSREVTQRYGNLGIELSVDCNEMRMGVKIQVNDLVEPLKQLDRVFDVFEKSKYRPKEIRLGWAFFHSTKDQSIHLPLSFSTGDFQGILENLLTLMDFENKEFGQKIRFTLEDYAVGRNQAGEIVELGGGTLVAFDGDHLKKSLSIVKKYKTQILALQNAYPNVRIFFGNQFGYFIVKNDTRSYYFAPEVEDRHQRAYFDWLKKYQALRASYGEIGIVVQAIGYPDINFVNFNKMIQVANEIKNAVFRMNPRPRAVIIGREPTPEIFSGVTIGYSNGILRFPNVYGFEGRVKTSAELKKCLANLDPAKIALRCDSHGRPIEGRL